MSRCRFLSLSRAPLCAFFLFILIPSESPAGGAECDYIKCSGEWYEPWKCEWVTCPSSQVCEWLASPRKCRHKPPWEGEVCTVFSGTLDDPLNFCASDDNYCKGFTDFLAGTCTVYSKVGERCDGIHTVCANILGNTGRMCRPAEYYVGTPSLMQCYPNGRTFELDTDEDCRAAYSESVHERVIENYEESDGNSIYPMTISYASGAGLSGGVGISEEVGVVYSGDGYYACYRSSCAGLGYSAGGNWYVSQGIYDNSFADFERGKYFTDFSIDAVVAGRSYSAVREGEGLEKIGDLVTYWAGVDVAPGPVGADFVLCDTEIRYKYAWNPVEAVLESAMPRLECRNTSACADPTSCLADVSISARPGSEPVTVESVPQGPYAIGSRDVTLKSALKNQAVSCTAIAEVVDCTAPELQCAEVIAEATSSNGAFVSTPAPAYVDCSEVEFDLPDDGLYPLGKTEIYFTGTDADNNQSVCQTFVNVIDSTAPVVTAPGDMYVIANQSDPAVFIGMATATDAVGVVFISRDAPRKFPIGPTTVTWYAIDEAGNIGSATQVITGISSGGGAIGFAWLLLLLGFARKRGFNTPIM